LLQTGKNHAIYLPRDWKNVKKAEILFENRSIRINSGILQNEFKP